MRSIEYLWIVFWRRILPCTEMMTRMVLTTKGMSMASTTKMVTISLTWPDRYILQGVYCLQYKGVYCLQYYTASNKRPVKIVVWLCETR